MDNGNTARDEGGKAGAFSDYSRVCGCDCPPDRVLANLHLNVEINRPLLNSLTDRHSDVAVRALDWTDYIPEVESVDSPLLPCAGSNDNLEPSRVPPVINQCAADDEHLDSTDQTSTTNQIGFDGKGVGNVGRGCEEGDPLGRPDVVLAADVVYDIRWEIGAASIYQSMIVSITCTYLQCSVRISWGLQELFVNSLAALMSQTCMPVRVFGSL